MKYIHITILMCILLVPSTSCGEQKFFPKLSISKIPELHETLSAYYSKFLNIMNESSIYDSDEIIYRFLWLRTFNNPIMLRLNININKDQTGKMVIKLIEGSSGYPKSLGKISKNMSIEIPKQNISEFNSLARKEFWTKNATIEEFNCLDGATWIIEGVKDKKYHIQVVHCPKSTDNIYHLGMHLLKLSGLEIKDFY